MRRGLTWRMLLTAIIAVTSLYDSRKAFATTAEGYKSTLLAVGRFREIEGQLPSARRTRGERATLAVIATDEGIVRRLCAEQCLGARRKHWLALASWAIA